jgi:hypothetical protein
MVSFIDTHRAEYGVESICAQLPMAPAVLRAQGSPSRSGALAAETAA